ncbi:MAG: hypothetical protein HY699_17830 [Deltaproteobacteria bacterium]|nr:hypothetical protein [Deltaproteobacteria bacterium]
MENDFHAYRTVQTWYAGLRRQSNVDPDADPKRLATLRAFCEFVGKEPDDIIQECLRESGEQLKISLKGRRLYGAKIQEFEQQASGGSPGERARIGSTLRGFLIHNGIFIQAPSLLR